MYKWVPVREEVKDEEDNDNNKENEPLELGQDVPSERSSADTVLPDIGPVQQAASSLANAPLDMITEQAPPDMLLGTEDGGGSKVVSEPASLSSSNTSSGLASSLSTAVTSSLPDPINPPPGPLNDDKLSSSETLGRLSESPVDGSDVSSESFLDQTHRESVVPSSSKEGSPTVSAPPVADALEGVGTVMPETAADANSFSSNFDQTSSREMEVRLTRQDKKERNKSSSTSPTSKARWRSRSPH